MPIDFRILEENVGIVAKCIDINSGKLVHAGVVLEAPEGEEAADFVLAYEGEDKKIRYLCLPAPLIETAGGIHPTFEFHMGGQYYRGEGEYGNDEAEKVREILEKNKADIEFAEKTL